MAQANDDSSRANPYDFTRIKNLIEDGFMHDWAISIKYAVRTQQKIDWVNWDKTFFAIKDATPVLEKLKECCAKNPECSMKLVCEHFNPEYRLVYCLSRQENESQGIDCE